MGRRSGSIAAVCAIVLSLSSAARALEPDELLLVVNKNVRESRVLAEYYQTARQVPAGRIVELDLPVGDEISFAMYEQRVVPPLRAFLRDNGLENKVSCIVTFYGVPLRIAQRTISPAERGELGVLAAQQASLKAEILQKLHSAEAEARAADDSFQPASGEEPQQILQRAAAAIQVLSRHPTTRPAEASASSDVVALTKFFFGPAGVVRMLTDERPSPEMKELKREVEAVYEQILKLQEQRHDFDARKRLRKLVGETYGAIELLRLLQVQQEYLQSPSSTASLDSELALLWWTYYSRSQWQPNMLYYAVPPGVAARAARTLMVSRLDAPQAGQVRDIILASLKAEKDGLKGRVVLDSRGLAYQPQDKVGSYAWYDQSIREATELVQKAKLPLLFDDAGTVLPANSARDVAIYCGWYSVGNYVPSCQFSLGAVAFHVASFELVSLRSGNPKQWVRNLINDGVVATLGPVAEPYLHAFPRADDFFGLLLTGKLALAEVYWRTQPLTSWMMVLIGDPLYTPYKNNPALLPDDLPPRLRRLFEQSQPLFPATAPTTRP